MRPLDLYSEPFSPNGNVTSEGVLNQLGRPDLDVHTLLVRETVQNSWDARANQWGGVSFSVDGWTLNRDEGQALRDLVFAVVPERLPLGPVLRGERLHTDDDAVPPGLRLLAISDRGTVGLGGPTRADVGSGPGEPRNFVDFLRNVGLPPDRPMTGGSYGYGKAAAYIASRARTVIVHTRWQSPSGPESRFIAAGLGEAHVTAGPAGTNGMRTGRHWWGRLDGGLADPATGPEADELAAAIGLPTFGRDDFGTTVCVVDPYLIGEGLDDTVAFMVGAIVWNFWPKMLPDGDGNVPITFSATSEGRTVEVPDPRQFLPLTGFVAAYQSAQSDVEIDDEIQLATRVEQLRPIRTLGRLAVTKFPVRPADGSAASQLPPPFEGPAHHVALMRQVRLVVRYFEGPRLPVDAVQYGGVFIADPGVDDIYRESEPPSHDEWRASILTNRTDRSAIISAERAIRNALERFAAPVADSRPPTGGGRVAELARDLAFLLPGLEGPGAEDQDHGDAGPRPKRRRAKVRIVETFRPESVEGSPVVRVACTVEPVDGTEGTLVAAKARVALEDGSFEADPPSGAETPQVMFWAGPDGRRVDGDRVFIEAADRGVWTVHVNAVPHLVTGIEIEAMS